MLMVYMGGDFYHIIRSNLLESPGKAGGLPMVNTGTGYWFAPLSVVSIVSINLNRYFALIVIGNRHTIAPPP